MATASLCPRARACGDGCRCVHYAAHKVTVRMEKFADHLDSYGQFRAAETQKYGVRSYGFIHQGCPDATQQENWHLASFAQSAVTKSANPSPRTSRHLTDLSKKILLLLLYCHYQPTGSVITTRPFWARVSKKERAAPGSASPGQELSSLPGSLKRRRWLQYRRRSGYLPVCIPVIDGPVVMARRFPALPLAQGSMYAFDTVHSALGRFVNAEAACASLVYMHRAYYWSQVLAILLPVLGMSVIRWFVSRKVVQGVCPNCGANIQGLRGGQPQTCFTCGKAFRVDADDTFVRVGTKFSSEGNPFGAGSNPFGAGSNPFGAGGFPFGGRGAQPGTGSPFGAAGSSNFRQQGTPNASSGRGGASSSSKDDDIIDAEIVE
eukprot:jgi/Mesvir1/1615/Mv05057-RA.1